MAFDWSMFNNVTPKAYGEYKGSLENYQEPFEQYKYKQADDSRGLVDRLFDMLQIGNYATAGALYNATDKDPNTSALSGVVEGIKAGNPFGKGNEEGEKVFGDVLGNVGWNPEHLPGKVAKGAVGLAGDIFLDPLSYVNPFSAASKVIGGTGTAVKGFKLPSISLDAAEKAVKSSYVKFGIDLDTLPNGFIEKEIADLQTRINNGFLKVRKTGEDFQIGGKNLPFASKIKIPGTSKALDDFTIKLIEAKKLRSIGDKTIAPYYNGLIQRVKDTKMLRKFKKDLDFYDMAKTDPVRAATMFHISQLTKGVSSSAIGKDIKTMIDVNALAKKFSNIEDADAFLKMYDDGTLKAQMETKGYIAKKIDTMHGNTNATEQFKAQEKAIDEAVKIVRGNVEAGELPNKTITPTPKLREMLEKVDEDFLDKLMQDNLLSEDINEQIRNIARTYNVGGYDDLEKSFDNNKYIDSAAQEVLDAKIQEIMPLFASGGKYHKNLVAEFARSQVTETGKALNADDFNIQKIIQESKLNTLRYKNPSKVKIVQTINDEYFHGLDFIPESVSDDVVDDLLEAMDLGDKTRVDKIMNDIDVARPVNNKPSAKLFDSVTEDVNKKYGFKFKKPIAYWLDGKKKVTVQLADLPKYAKDYVETRNVDALYAKINQDMNDLRGIDAAGIVAKQKGRFDDVKKYRFQHVKLVARLKYNQRLINNISTINKYRVMLEEAVKATGVKNIEELSNFDINKLESFANEVHKTSINKYNYINDTKLGYKFDEAVDYTEHAMNRKMADFEAEKFDPDALLEKGIDVRVDDDGNRFYEPDVPLSERMDYDQWKLSEFKREQKELAQILNGPGEVEELTTELNDVRYRLKNFKRSKNNKQYLEDVVREKEILEILNKNKPVGLDDVVNKQITDAVEPETTGISYLSENPSAIKKYKGGTEADNVEIKILNDIKQTFEELTPPSDIPMDKDEFSTAVVKWLDSRMEKIGKKEVKYGRLAQGQLDARRGKYVPQIRTQEAIDWVKANAPKMYDESAGYNPSEFAVGYERLFNKGREFDTIAQANKEMKELTGVEKWFEDDLIKIIETRMLAHNRLTYNDDMVNAVRRIAGKDFEFGKKLDGYTPVVSFVDLNAALMKKYGGKIPDDFFTKINDGVEENMKIYKEFFTPNNAYIPVTNKQVKTIIEYIKDGDNADKPFRGLSIFNLDDTIVKRLNVESKIQKRMHMNAFIKVYDKWLSIYKNLNTTVLPGFHIQNFISNEFQSYLANGIEILNPAKLKTANDIFSGKTPSKLIKLGDIELTHNQLKALAEKYGILSNTFFKEDLRFGIADAGYGAKIGIPGKYDPTDLNAFRPYKEGAKVGSRIEGSQRLVLFIEELKAGKSMDEAVDTVNKYMFDYGDLTDFEKDTMKRIIPFYTFMRKNIPMELNEILENPNKFRNIDKVFDEIENMSGKNEIPDSQRNKWRKDYVQMPFQLDGEDFGFNPQLPYQQLDRISPLKILGQSTPVIKTPFEAITGKYAYTGIPIEGVGEYLASQIAPTKAINHQTDKDGIEKLLYMLGQTTGLPTGTL